MHVHHSSRAGVTVLSFQTSLSLTRVMIVTVAKEMYYFDTGNFSLTLGIFCMQTSTLKYEYLNARILETELSPMLVYYFCIVKSLNQELKIIVFWLG